MTAATALISRRPALTSQVVGWLLISYSLPRLAAALTSVLLTAQPVGSSSSRC